MRTTTVNPAKPRPRSPKRSALGWRARPVPRIGDLLLQALMFQRGPLCVISGLEVAELPDGTGTGPQWHVSVSRANGRPTDDDMRIVLRDFELVGAEEDNHHPGVARHFWMPVDPAHRVDCECKIEEETIVEPDGYRWTNPRAGEGACRGCELELMVGQRCPIHATASAGAR
jgi:hypothetical protein